MDQTVCAWRYHSLIRAGFTASQAEMVATDADIDVHWLIDLTRKGCPHGTACRNRGPRPSGVNTTISPSTTQRDSSSVLMASTISGK